MLVLGFFWLLPTLRSATCAFLLWTMIAIGVIFIYVFLLLQYFASEANVHERLHLRFSFPPCSFMQATNGYIPFSSIAIPIFSTCRQLHKKRYRTNKPWKARLISTKAASEDKTNSSSARAPTLCKFPGYTRAGRKLNELVFSLRLLLYSPVAAGNWLERNWRLAYRYYTGEGMTWHLHASHGLYCHLIWESWPTHRQFKYWRTVADNNRV